ncbi:MAG: 4-hydroxy-tetrahydrodipicolinate reductase [Firmicutes bacterium]|nr:4-hydroxy-tetrahydrodipicolinate reductase [Bacillota bacterium]
MLKVILSGCGGKMGAVVAGVAPQNHAEIVAGIDKSTVARAYPVFESPSLCDIKADVVIDFSHPSALGGLLDYCAAKNLPAVIATTGLTEELRQKLQKTGEKTAIFYASNLSVGVFVLNKLVKQATLDLTGFDIEITERHHAQKIDAPSGTALTLLNSIQSVLPSLHPVFDRHAVSKKRDKNEIGIHAVRGGTIMGEHEILFAGENEIIEIRHAALSKDIFASGAYRAARFIVSQKPGLYGMGDLIN